MRGPQLSVQRTHDLTRVLALPRRKLTLAAANEASALLSPMLSLTPTDALRAWQGQALLELAEQGGLYLGMPVGGGKTLIAWLAPIVCDAERPIYLAPGGLRGDVQKLWRSYHGRWRAHKGGIPFHSYESLTDAGNVDLLERLQPDLIILDEADCLRNPRSSMVKRLDRYVTKYAPKVVAMTGTMARLSILDCCHVLRWCLRERAPVPLRSGECHMWGAAIDEAKGWSARVHPGWLCLFVDGTRYTETSLQVIREGFRARLLETPGVVVVDGDSCDQPISIVHECAPYDPVLEEHFHTFRKENVTPGGIPLSDQLSIFRLAGEIGCGFHQPWDPPAPADWRAARYAFCDFVREVIESSHEELDTEAAVARAYPAEPAVREWYAIRKSFTPTPKPEWLSMSVVKHVAERLRELPPTLVWTSNRAFGDALSRASGLTYFGEGGNSASGANIRDADPTRSHIISFAANKRGRNLQAWSENYYVNPPRAGRDREQSYGRTHRSLQSKPVRIIELMTSGESFDGFDKACTEAEFGRSTFGLTQKLLRMQVTYTRRPEDSPYRWAQKAKD